MNGLIIFDMDGTLADTSPNIFKSYIHVAEKMNFDKPDLESLYNSLGGPLTDNIGRLYNLKDEEIKIAVDIYREYYSTLPLVNPYRGIPDVLNVLKKSGYALAVATLKRKDFAEDLIEHWGLDEMFSSIQGSDERDSKSKSQMIDTCMKETGFSNLDTTMIGDSLSDYEASLKSDVSFIGASYGFSLPERMCIECNIQYVLDPIGILNIVKI